MRKVFLVNLLFIFLFISGIAIVNAQNTVIQSVLTADAIDLNLKGTTKNEIINELIDILTRNGKIHDREAALNAVLIRENKMSTGLSNGIAIPEGRCSAVNDLIACIGISENPIDFDSIDQQPSRIFIITLFPEEKTNL